MGNEAEAGSRTHHISLDTIEIKLRQEFEMEPRENEPSTSEITLSSVDDRTKQATILRRKGELYALPASRIRLESTGNSKATSLRRDARPLATPVTGTTHTMW